MSFVTFTIFVSYATIYHMSKGKKKNFDTYVFIDVSNIRSACYKSCGFKIDFIKLYNYLKNKYPKLKDVRYYEGIARNDKDKESVFEQLSNVGYTIRSLRRRAYNNPAIMKSFECRQCGRRNRVEIMPRETKMKSNVDVFLASEMLEIAYEAKNPIRIIIFSCDGDYAEAIRIAAKNKNVNITVIATPSIRDRNKNSLSIRLKELKSELIDQYHLNNINDIKDNIKL